MEEGEGRTRDGDETNSNSNSNSSKICCLCGDVGFADALLRCTRCGYRLQHSYCSRLYPDKIEMESWGCEWCIHQQQQQQQQQQQEEEEIKKEEKKGVMMTRASGAHGVKGSGVGPSKIHKSGGSGSKAVDRWRKLARAAKMGSGRRYKLLADVLCS